MANDPSHPEDWLSLDPPVCIWCHAGEEHHGVGRKQGEHIERLEMILTRVSVDVLAYINPSLMMEVYAVLDDEEWRVWTETSRWALLRSWFSAHFRSLSSWRFKS